MIQGFIDTSIGKIPVVATRLERPDILGSISARLSFNRSNYKVEPGIYAVGKPGPDSIVLVSANYKLSFDALRRELGGLNAWIMVLDTKGINVWCAAGKGTFGTAEIVNRIEKTNLKGLVNHTKLILPQLGAPGVSAHEVRNLSGFSVIYGPVRAKDLPEFISSGMKATAAMRRVSFSLTDRLTLAPVEFVTGFKYLVVAASVFFLFSGLNRHGYSPAYAAINGIPAAVNLFLIFFAGTVLGPVLLPWLPGASFSSKGVYAGLLGYLASFLLGFSGDPINSLSWILMSASTASFILMNFTGSSTYTSFSGVKKEMKKAVPLQAIGFSAGFILWLIGRFVQ